MTTPAGLLVEVEADLRSLSPIQFDMLVRVVKTNGGGLNGYSEDRRTWRSLEKRGLIQGKSGLQCCFVHTRKGLALYRYACELANQDPRHAEAAGRVTTDMQGKSELEREMLSALKSAHAHLFTCATKLERCAQAGGNADFAVEALIHPYRAACLEIQKVLAKATARAGGEG
jgi:hypothetical protein